MPFLSQRSRVNPHPPAITPYNIDSTTTLTRQLLLMCSSNNATSKENNVNDKIDLDNVFDKLTSMTPDRLEKVMDKFNLAQERQRATQEDREAKESGIERITLFFAGGHKALLVKPNPLTGTWLLNLYGAGTVTAPQDVNVEFEVTDHFTELFRFSMTFNGFTYWHDLVDEQMAQELAAFLNVPLQVQ